MIKTFHGRIADDEQQIIRLSTNDGLTGYKIKKFSLMPFNLNAAGEACVKVFTAKQPAATFVFDFTVPTLLASAYYTVHGSADVYSEDLNVIFDNRIFNQDIYITHKNNDVVDINYYLELEQIKLDLNEATVATLKDMRGRE
jgi:hypothetical protein